MPNLANRWAGRIYGTNTGNVFLDLVQDDQNISGKLRIMDAIFGVSIYDYTGSIDDELLLNCTPAQAVEGVELGNVTIRGRLTQEGHIRGEWESTIGTAGTFEIYPHDLASADPGAENRNPEQIHNKTIQLGSVRLFKDDLIQLIGFIKKDFSKGRVIVTYSLRGSELTKYADDFFEQLDGIEQLNYIKLVVQEPEAYGINRVIVVELVANGVSEVRVSGINESWVLGKAESIFQTLKPKQNSLVTTYRKYGLNLNGAIFFAMLIAIPDIEGWKSRAIFVVSVFLLLNFLLFIHNKYIPNTAIYLEQAKPGFFKRAWPSILSWVIAASSSVVAAYIFSLLKSGGS
ncbi:hypothetical protein [Shewanella algae]|uniref:hypothetical protein n=1 Tax=Shewanella algae TaxID=38313 RepID=UPI001181F992|nr:hypothetical protein [Shewanella algae]MBO2621435.1 hypothetical protein [Shewanella algae]MBO2663569.1 hypothetical protein [Shewanella algae]MBO2697523.1 hypothetical protein [Shewanella algae]MCL1054272.1 hypothetical protein [Shewanella algae]TVO86236.1 hypothetical protein AYI80_16255 [Shewanella algae]